MAIEPGSQDLAADVSVVFAMELTGPGRSGTGGVRSWVTVSAVADRPETPPWRQGFDALERQLSPRLEALVQSEQFAVAVGLAARVQRALSRSRRRTSTRRVLHGLNLPAGTDVSRILNELGQLKRQVRELSTQLDDAQAELQAARSAPAAATARGHAPRKAAAAQAVGGPKGRLTWPPPSLPASSSSGSARTPSATCCGSATGSSTSPASAGRS